MSGAEEAILTELRELRAEVGALRQLVRPAHPPELTVRQAMVVTNHRSRDAFYDWCRRKRVRPLSRGRYALRRLEAALAA